MSNLGSNSRSTRDVGINTRSIGDGENRKRDANESLMEAKFIHTRCDHYLLRYGRHGGQIQTLDYRVL